MTSWAVGMGSARLVGLDRIGDKGRGHSSGRIPMENEEADASPAKEAPYAPEGQKSAWEPT